MTNLADNRGEAPDVAAALDMLLADAAVGIARRIRPTPALHVSTTAATWPPVRDSPLHQAARPGSSATSCGELGPGTRTAPTRPVRRLGMARRTRSCRLRLLSGPTSLSAAAADTHAPVDSAKRPTSRPARAVRRYSNLSRTSCAVTSGACRAAARRARHARRSAAAGDARRRRARSSLGVIRLATAAGVSPL